MVAAALVVLLPATTPAAVTAGAVCASTGDQAAIQNFIDSCVQSVAVAVGSGTLGPDPVTCNADLGTCNGNLGTCTGNLGTCNSDLSTTNANLAACTGDLATANAGTAAVGDVLSGKTFTSTAGLDATGTMPNNGAVTLTPNTSDQAIAAGYHDGTGKCEGDADLVAENVRDGVNLFGVAGTLSAGGGVPKTGQTICYNTAGSVIACAGTAHDGELQKGTARSFTDNGDGSIHDKDNTYTWANAFASKVATLNSTMFAGHNDWRVPNRFELETLLNPGAVNPTTYSAFNTACAAARTVLTCICTRPDNYWSSSTYQSSPSGAWFVFFYYGYTYLDLKTYGFGLRAVRAG